MQCCFSYCVLFLFIQVSFLKSSLFLVKILPFLLKTSIFPAVKRQTIPDHYERSTYEFVQNISKNSLVITCTRHVRIDLTAWVLLCCGPVWWCDYCLLTTTFWIIEQVDADSLEEWAHKQTLVHTTFNDCQGATEQDT